MTYWLLEHPNPAGPFYHPTRNNPIRIIVLHTAENLPDFIPTDTGAEAVAHYASTTTRAVSWHATVDSDSIIDMLPDSYTAFHVRNYNSIGLGVEMATRANSWATAPDVWVEAVISNLADVVRSWAEAYDIPYRRLTRVQVDAGEKGVVGHATLDPTRRSDPGQDFPWDILWARLAQEDTMPDPFWDNLKQQIIDTGGNENSLFHVLELLRSLGERLDLPANDPEAIAEALTGDLPFDHTHITGTPI